jgi:exosortase
MSTAPATLSSLVSPDLSRKVARYHPLRRLRIERWTFTHAAAAAGMGALGVLATLEAWRDIFTLAWKETEYSHIFLVPVVALWMVFARRLRIRHCRPIGTPLGVLVALAGWALYAFGYYNGYQTLFHAGAVAVVIGCVLSVLGKHALFRFFPALAVLVFLIPVPPDVRLRIAGPLQAWTAEVSQAVLDLFGVPVLREGNMLTVNGQQVTIVEACNGLRMVFALILVSYAFSFGLPLRNSVRLIVLLASPVSAILCNVVRIVPNAWCTGTGRRTPA